MTKERITKRGLVIIIYIMCFLLLLIGFFLFLGFKDANQCLESPFVYGINQLEGQAGSEIYCTCYFESPEYAPFYFNNEKIGVLTDFSKNLE